MTISLARPALLLFAGCAFMAAHPAFAQHHDADPAHKTGEHHAPSAPDHEDKKPKADAEHKDDAHKAGDHKNEHGQHPQGH
jgi:hypothetical protein